MIIFDGDDEVIIVRDGCCRRSKIIIAIRNDYNCSSDLMIAIDFDLLANKFIGFCNQSTIIHNDFGYPR